MKEIAGYLPRFQEGELEYRTLTFEGKSEKLDIQVPVLSKQQLDDVIAVIKQASANILKSLTVTEIIQIIDRVIEQLLDRTNPYRQKAEKLLPIVTGYDEELIRIGLTNYLKTFRKQNLQRFLVEDFGNPLLLDDFQPRTKRGFSKAVGANLTVQIWSGNVPALPLWSLISNLLVKSGTIGKVPSAEPLFAGWFANMIVETEPRLADCLAVIWWKGGDEEKERQLFQQADIVLAYGGNQSLESIKSRVPITTRFLPFGHKISFGIVSKISLDSRKAWKTVRDAAYDVIRYDQQGCYSPHLFYVQKGGNVSPREFARYLAHELENFEQRYPRRTLSIEEGVSLAEWRQKEEMSLFTKQEKEVLGEQNGSWTVVFGGNEGELTPSCLNRVIKVVEVDELIDVLPNIEAYRTYLQTVGIAASPNELFQMAELLGAAGVTRITALGHMTSPEAGWHHDGRFNLLDLVNMVDIEHSAEEYAESLASYVD
ncbi:acyl-CoA reductase [Metabacillus sediminilitoris]|uniref:Acyl-CoA reductase n=1 Tax=Metabacillus sediminilitoris TaxID=2567941 RepID=A0A4S4BTZ9_9BACI|nr:acyl-CoA reductase [Metabacillus sediminilitoris]QGQ44931.1 acyl-CoA reductase [Metabacillus sediminilitoris]THF78564.1 acyl-CoA reductase [Metabacillus sediminilitoris]